MAESPLDDLLDQYQELLDAGRVPDLAELCRRCPELRDELGRRVVRLHRLGSLLGDPPAVPPPEPEPLSLSDDKTWVGGAVAGDTTVVEIPAPSGYEIIEPLGEGGMGIVYKARQVGLNRLVALKMILAGARARAIDLKRFQDEARAIAALRHPNIVQIFEVGEYRGRPFFSLEFCAGGTLARALNGEPQAPEVAAGMAEVLARAIASAHERNIIHRDLKPANVLLAIEGEAHAGGLSTMVGDAPAENWKHLALRSPQAAFKITDFGLAKRVDDDSGRTLDGSVMGTPSYMAPEQASGETRAIGRCSDIWALGAILYELLTGRPPFRGSTVVDTLEQVRSRDPVRVRQLQPRVPADLETICLKCLQKDPRRRYLSTAALADDLRRFQEGRPIHGRPVGRLTQAWRWCRREPRTAGLIAAVLLLAIWLPAVLVRFGDRLSRAEEREEEQRKAAVAAKKAEHAAQVSGETHRYYAAVSVAARLRAQPRAGWTWDALDAATDAAAADTPHRDWVAVRSEVSAALGAIDLRPIGSVADELQAGALAFAPDGRLAVAPYLCQSIASLAFVTISDPVTGAEQKLAFPGTLTRDLVDATTALAFTPDGRRLFLALRSGTVFRWDLDGTSAPVRSSWDAHAGQVNALTFSPDSKWVYTAGNDGLVKRWPADRSVKDPSAKWPATAAEAKGRSRTSLAWWTIPRPGILTFGPDGARLLDPESLVEVKPTNDLVAPAFPGCDGLAVVHPPTATAIVQQHDKLEVICWEQGICQSVGRLVDPRLENGRAHAGRIHAMSLHPSGLLLATVCPDEGLAKLWDLAAGELAVTVPAPGGRALAFSADGNTLAVGGDHTTTRYELGGLREQMYLGRRGLPLRAAGRTADGLIATIAAAEQPDNAQLLRTIVSVWGLDGKLEETILHRANGQVGTGHFRIAASRRGGWTAFHAGDTALTWRAADKTTTTIETNWQRRPFFDLSLDAAGRAWSLEGKELLGHREPGTGGKARTVVPAWMPGGGRKDLASVLAGDDVVVVGCDNGYVRVVRSDGGPTRSCACFGKDGPAWLTDRANTVRSVNVTADNTLAIAGTEDGRLWLIGLPDANPVADWAAHADRVTAVAFDGTGTWLASGSRDGEVRLWKRNGNGYDPYITLPAGRPLREVFFSPSGDALMVLREGDSAVRVWHLDRLHQWFREAGME